MFRIRVGDFRLGPGEKKAINKVLDSGRLSEGAKVEEFERRWAKFIGSRYCVAMNSGTSALIAGLHALKHLYRIKDGTKVITSPLTFIATVNAIVASRLEPVFVDVDQQTFVIKTEEVSALLKKEKGISLILPVHLMGYPVAMDEINRLASQYRIVVMEDAAQAHGTLYKNKKLGTYGALAGFSFYIAHNIQAGEMGAVVTSDLRIYKLLKKIKAHGRMCDCPVCVRMEGKCPRLNSFKGKEDFDPRFYHDILGFNFKAMEFQAALGLVQLAKVEDILKKRKENVRYLNAGLKPWNAILQLPQYSENVSYLAYPIVIKRPEIISRKLLRQELERAGIETRPLFGCVPTQQPAYAYLRKKYAGKLPNAQYLGANGFYIGCHQYLTKEDLDFTIKGFQRILQ